MAIGGHAKTLLQLADVVAQIEIKMPVEIGDLVTEACEFFLQRDALGAGRLEIVDRPGAAERARAVQPVGEMRHRERVGVRVVVGFEHDEILRHQKRRAGRAARKEQNGVAGLGPAAAVEAFKAGNDLLVIPPDLGASYESMLKAVRSGEISRERLDRSVLKILKIKGELGLNKSRTIDLGAIATVVGKPESIAFGQQVADSAITLVRDNGKVLPLKSQGTAKAGLPYMTKEETHNQVVAVLFSDDVRTDSGRAFGREFRARIPDARVIYVDPRIAAGMSDEVLKAIDEAQTVVAAVYVIPTAGKIDNSMGMADATGTLLQQLLDHAAAKTAVVAMGNPYLASDFPEIENYMCTFSNATVSEVAAIKALFGEIPIRGHLPVTIPNVAQRGAGLEPPAPVAKGASPHAQN